MMIVIMVSVVINVLSVAMIDHCTRENYDSANVMGGSRIKYGYVWLKVILRREIARPYLTVPVFNFLYIITTVIILLFLIRKFSRDVQPHAGEGKEWLNMFAKTQTPAQLSMRDSVIYR